LKIILEIKLGYSKILLVRAYDSTGCVSGSERKRREKSKEYCERIFEKRLMKQDENADIEIGYYRFSMSVS